MPARQTFFNESTAEVTTTSAAYADHSSVTFTTEASTDYWVIASGIFRSDSITAQGRARLFDSTNSVSMAETIFEAKDTTDFTSVYALFKFTSGASPPSTTFKWQIYSEGGQTVGLKEARILVLKSDSADQWAASDTESTTTSVTQQDKTTLTFTPATAGEYLVLAYSEVKSSLASTNRPCITILDKGGTEYSRADVWHESSTNYLPWWGAWKSGSLSGSQTFKTRYMSLNADTTVGIKNSRILALRLDKFDNSYHAEDRTAATGTNTTYTDRLSLTQTPNAVEHVILGGALLYSSSTTLSTQLNFLEGSTSFGEVVAENGATSRYRSHFWVTRRTLTASSTTWKLQTLSEAGTATNGYDEQFISVLQTAANPGGGGGPTVAQLSGFMPFFDAA